MVAMSVRDKYIVNRSEVNTHLLGIAYKDITGSSVKQDTMFVCF